MEEAYVRRGAAIFDQALACVSAAGFHDELAWARGLSLNDLTERQFLRELAWCILNAGMRERIVRSLFPRIASCFWTFRSCDDICSTRETCIELARRYFNHEGKLRAIADGAERVRSEGGFEALRRRLSVRPLEECEAFPYIGPTTRWHLARNIGVDCAKPDRHLVRLARSVGCRDVQRFCLAIAAARNERIGVVDLVLWRHSETMCKCLSASRDVKAAA